MAYGIPRANYIAGARAMLDWLEAHPDTNLPSLDKVLVALTTNSAVEEWATAHGLTDLVTYDDEGNASADVEFGPVTLHVYGYRDFTEHSDKLDGRTAERYAAKHGLELVEAVTSR